MKLFTILAIAFISVLACNENRGGEKDPAEMHPPSEAIPDSMQLVNDSLIMPDTTPGNGSQVGGSDTLKRNR
jgi:hypothetical protein